MKLSGARGTCGLFFVLFLCLSCSLRPAISYLLFVVVSLLSFLLIVISFCVCVCVM